jgi:hypothetical protein
MVGAQHQAFSPVLRMSAGADIEDVNITNRLLRPECRHLAVAGALAVGCIVALSAAPWLPTRRPRHAAVREAISAQLLGLDRLVANTCGTLDVDVDYEYSGLAGVGHLDNVVGSQDCCTLCQGEPSCKAFTWVQNAHLLTGNPGQCWLKGGEYRASNTKKGVFSAFVRDPAMEATVFARKKAAMTKKRKDEVLTPGLAKKKVVAKREVEAGTTVKQKVAAVISTEVTTTLGITTLPTPVPLIVVGVLPTETDTSTTTTSTLASTATQTLTETSTVTSTSTISTTQTSTETSTIMACCSFEPFVGCGSALNISYFCDISQKHCEQHCAGKWLLDGAGQLTKGLDVHPPTPPPKPTPPPPRKDNGPCCSFEPLKACGDELAISKFCDISKKRCEKDCAGHWLESGPSEKPNGLNLYE